jgi:RNA recognition motif-containing protein
MIKTLYVGNLSDEVTGGNLTELFAAHGTVESARVVIDRGTGRSKGFGFVEMKTVEEAQAATTALNGHTAAGKPLTVREAKLRPKGGPSVGTNGSAGPA